MLFFFVVGPLEPSKYPQVVFLEDYLLELGNPVLTLKPAIWRICEIPETLCFLPALQRFLACIVKVEKIDMFVNFVLLNFHENQLSCFVRWAISRSSSSQVNAKLASLLCDIIFNVTSVSACVAFPPTPFTLKCTKISFENLKWWRDWKFSSMKRFSFVLFGSTCHTRRFYFLCFRSHSRWSW